MALGRNAWLRLLVGFDADFNMRSRRERLDSRTTHAKRTVQSLALGAVDAALQFLEEFLTCHLRRAIFI